MYVKEYGNTIFLNYTSKNLYWYIGQRRRRRTASEDIRRTSGEHTENKKVSAYLHNIFNTNK
jgi:hypothetical protein